MFLPMHPEDPALWRVWDRCWPWLRRAAERSGTHEEADVLASVVWTGKSQFWPANDSAAITEIITMPAGKIFQVWLAGGRLETLKAMFADMEAWGRSVGCKAIQVTGREGWERVLPGMSRRAVVLAKEL